jgi:hypothetical protein
VTLADFTPQYIKDKNQNIFKYQNIENYKTDVNRLTDWVTDLNKRTDDFNARNNQANEKIDTPEGRALVEQKTLALLDNDKKRLDRVQDNKDLPKDKSGERQSIDILRKALPKEIDGKSIKITGDVNDLNNLKAQAPNISKQTEPSLKDHKQQQAINIQQQLNSSQGHSQGM